MSSYVDSEDPSSARLAGLAARANSDLVFSYRWPNDQTQPGSFQVALRGSDFASQWPHNGYVVEFSPTSPTVSLIRRFHSVTTNTVSANAQQDPTAKHWVRFQVQGSQIRFRTWLAGHTEPTGWNATYTDPAPLAAGQTSFSILTENGSLDGPGNYVLVDDLTVRSLP
jgi:hypothetical protein